VNQSPISPSVSQATTSAATWFNENAHRYAPADRELFHKLFGLVTEPLHILVLSEELRRRMFSEREPEEREQEHSDSFVSLPRDSGMDPTQESKLRVVGGGGTDTKFEKYMA